MQAINKVFLYFVVLSVFWITGLSGCAYQFGKASRSIPGGYKTISLPVFKNRSYETGMEVVFTNALIQEFTRSQVARVVNDDVSDVRIEGEILSIDYYPTQYQTAGDTSAPYLPKGSVLASQYLIDVKVMIRVLRRSDQAKLWESTFASQKSYAAPVVTLPGVNSVNPLYNLSAKRQNLQVVAADIMAEAHSRITENF